MANALISKQIFSTISLRKCMEISLENLYLDIGAGRANSSAYFYTRNFSGGYILLSNF